MIVAYRNGAPIRVRDVAQVSDSVEDIRATGLWNGKPAITVIIFRQPGANIIAKVDRVRELLPQLRARAGQDTGRALYKRGGLLPGPSRLAARCSRRGLEHLLVALETDGVSIGESREA